jgi:hypothetical protein
MDAIDHYEVLRGRSVGIVPVLTRYCVSSTALVPHLQSWHFHWLVPYSQWATCIHVCYRIYVSFLKETLLQSSKHIVWVTTGVT